MVDRVAAGGLITGRGPGARTARLDGAAVVAPRSLAGRRPVPSPRPNGAAPVRRPPVVGPGGGNRPSAGRGPPAGPPPLAGVASLAGLRTVGHRSAVRAMTTCRSVIP